MYVWKRTAAMTASPYRVTPARIGNSSGLRLPASWRY
jgi:hypothetical protein